MKPFLLLAALALAACQSAADLEALRRAASEGEALVIQRTAIANNFHQYRKEREALQAKVDAAFGGLAKADAAQLTEALAKACPGATTRVDGGPSGISFVVSGAGGREALLGAMKGVANLGPAIAVRTVEIDATSWNLEGFLPRPGEPPPVTKPAPFRPTLPPEAFYENEEAKELRNKIAHLTQDIWTLDKIVGDVATVAADKRAAEAVLASFEGPDRPEPALKTAESLYGKLLASGRLSFSPTAIAISSGRAAPGVDAEAAALELKTLGTVQKLDWSPDALGALVALSKE